jgi:hypothetical protein
MEEYEAGLTWETNRRRIEGGRLKGFETAPARFSRVILGDHLWSKQREIVEAVATHRRVAVQSCHDIGKSFCAATAVAWWLSCWPPGEAFVVTTAPTFPQVKFILWKEIARAHRKGRLPGRTNQVEWWIDGEIVAYGRKPDDLDMAAFQGIHARRVLVVVDEACGVAILDVREVVANMIRSTPTSLHPARVCAPGGRLWGHLRFCGPRFGDDATMNGPIRGRSSTRSAPTSPKRISARSGPAMRWSSSSWTKPSESGVTRCRRRRQCRACYRDSRLNASRRGSILSDRAAVGCRLPREGPSSASSRSGRPRFAPSCSLTR